MALLIKELQVGDLVMYNGCFVRVYSIQSPLPRRDRLSDKSVITLFLNGLIDASEDEIEPIPLSEEILEKNIPFERYWDATRSNPKGSVSEWRKDIDTAIIFVWDFRDKRGEYILEIQVRGCENYGVKKSIYYVHELQRAMRCCGLWDLADKFVV